MGLRNQSGFTLVELMITIVILAVLLGLGLPSFQGVMRSNRIATTTNELTASLSLARNEAIKRAQWAGVCPSSAGTACDGADWASGWLVWADSNGDGALGAGEDVLRFAAGRGGIVAGGAAAAVVFDARGRRMAAADQVITLRPDECGDQPLQRTLTVNRTGQARIVKGDCS